MNNNGRRGAKSKERVTDIEEHWEFLPKYNTAPLTPLMLCQQFPGGIAFRVRRSTITFEKWWFSNEIYDVKSTREFLISSCKQAKKVWFDMSFHDMSSYAFCQDDERRQVFT